MKLAVVTPIPTPYRDGFWNVLAAREDIDLTVLYCAEGKNDRPWQGTWPRDYRWEILHGRNLLAWCSANSSLFYNPCIRDRLTEQAPDAVMVGGYNHATMLIAIRYCLSQNIPYFLMCESHLDRKRSQARQLAKDRLVRWVVRNMCGGLPTGLRAEQYLLHYGALEASIARLPNVPDICLISEQVARLRTDRGSLRRSLGLNDSGPVALFAGRLVPQKGARSLLKALSLMQSGQELQLAVVGDGPEHSALQRQTALAGLTTQVHFAGFVEPSELVRWYAAADFLVLPSQETWGVVVLEALAAGLPVIVSDGVGCHPDLVVDPTLGKVVCNSCPKALADALDEMLRAGFNALNFEKAWRPLAQALNYESQAKALNKYLLTQIEERQAK